MKAFVFSVYGDHAELMKCHDVSEKEGFPAKRDPYAEPDRGEDIVIPAEYQGKPVTKIGPMAFFGPDIRSVQIPETVSLIHRYAFSCCESINFISSRILRVFPDCGRYFWGWVTFRIGAACKAR